MQVNLKESEIGKAVELFLQEQGIKTYGKDVTMQFSMGKGANGLKVQIDIEDNPNFFDTVRTIPLTTDPVPNPVRLLPTNNTDADEPAAKSTVTTLIDKHTKAVAAEAKPEPVAEPTAEDKAVIAAMEETQEYAPWDKEEPADETLAAVDAGEPEATIETNVPVEGAAAESAPEPVVEAVKAPRKAIFGKKPAAAAVAEPVAEPVVETEPALAEAGDDAGFDLPQGDAPVAEPVAKPGLPRRSVGSLFKKPAA